MTQDKDQLSDQPRNFNIISPQFPKFNQKIFDLQLKQFEIPINDTTPIAIREKIYRENLDMIATVNKEEKDYNLGINRFSFLTPEERLQYMGDTDDTSPSGDRIDPNRDLSDAYFDKEQEQLMANEAALNALENSYLLKMPLYREKLNFLFFNPFPVNSMFWKLWRNGYRGKDWK